MHFDESGVERWIAGRIAPEAVIVSVQALLEGGRIFRNVEYAGSRCGVAVRKWKVYCHGGRCRQCGEPCCCG